MRDSVKTLRLVVAGQRLSQAIPEIRACMKAPALSYPHLKANRPRLALINATIAETTRIQGVTIFDLDRAAHLVRWIASQN